MARNLAYLLPENLYRVFNETDLDKRKAAIADLWNEDGIFIDPLGVHQGHEKLNAAVTALQHQFPGSVFRVTSPIQDNRRNDGPLICLVGVRLFSKSLTSPIDCRAS